MQDAERADQYARSSARHFRQLLIEIFSEWDTKVMDHSRVQTSVCRDLLEEQCDRHIRERLDVELQCVSPSTNRNEGRDSVRVRACGD